MTPDQDKNTLMSRVIEVVSEQGFEGMAQAFAIIFNEAMRRERSAVG